METKSLQQLKSFKHILPIWYNNKSWQQKLNNGLIIILLILMASQVSTFIWNIVFPPEYSNVSTVSQSATQTYASNKPKQKQKSLLAENTWFGISQDLAINQMNAEIVVSETALNLSLKGTITGSIPQAFIVDNETGKTHLVKLNEEVIGGVTLTKINRRQIVITNNGKKETLSLPSVMLGGNLYKNKAEPTYTVLFERKAESRQIVKISAADLSYALGNLGALATEAKFIPRVAGGTTEGYKIMRMKNNSFLRKLSLQERDILLKLDNTLVSDKAKMFPMLMSLKDASKARLLIHRHGKNIALDIQVVN